MAVEGSSPGRPTRDAAGPIIGGIDQSLVGLCRIAGFFRVPADPVQLSHDLALVGRACTAVDLRRAATLLGLKSRIVRRTRRTRLSRMPMPALVGLTSGEFVIVAGITRDGEARVLDSATLVPRLLEIDDLLALASGEVVLLSRSLARSLSEGRFGFGWFLPSIRRFRRPLGHVLIASFFVQVFALVTPLFFQIVVDKVLAHKGTSTLTVIAIGMVGLGFFNVVLQYLRAYALSHTTTRIDVDLGARLFQHLLRLPLGYFETRAAGQTMARVRELDTIRGFLTGPALSSAIDVVFAVVFVAVLFAYSPFLASLVVGSIPIYVLIVSLVRPILRDKVREQFNRGAASQQFLVEAVVGIQTVKAAAVEPSMQASWEEKLAAYVRSSFDVTVLGSFGQNAIQYVNVLTTTGILFFGAKAVIAGTMTIGELIAFNMIAGQLTQPILRLSQLFQDFQQVQVSVERLGDILDTPAEQSVRSAPAGPPLVGGLEFMGVGFRYKPGMPEALSDIHLTIQPGEVIGIVGPSGSGKSTLSKLMQRFYLPSSGRLLIDGIDVAHMDPAWLRRQIGVVLQENLLFNRTLHDNIAFANPAMPRARVVRMAQLSGAHEFIARLPQGYDTMIEERGANLSGGQRQRIAIARALATDPRVLIFDEATSALDYDSERIIQDNMREIVKGRTVIVIAHRLAAVRGCDRIVGMHQGRIVEVGSHEDLLRRPDGLYAHLWRVQNGEPAKGAAE